MLMVGSVVAIVKQILQFDKHKKKSLILNWPITVVLVKDPAIRMNNQMMSVRQRARHV